MRDADPGTRLAMAAALALLTSACGASSNSEVSTGGSGGTAGGAGAGGQAGTSSSTGTGGAGGDCASRATFTEASHEVLSVTWPAGSATTAGTGQVHVWGRTVFTVNGTKLSGALQACGTALPPATLSGLVGGGMILIEIPLTAWDSSHQAQYQVDGAQSGWGVGSTLMYSYAALIGFTMTDGATATWPSSYTGITMSADPDGDGNPGLTSIPRSSAGYVLPPTSALGALGVGARADQLYLVIRNVASTMLSRTSCTDAAGTVNFMHFDNHVIGCHVSGGGACSSSEVQFIDENRTIYSVTSATITTKVVADGATCADVRAALPM